MFMLDTVIMHYPAALLDISNVALPTEIRKRDGRTVQFDSSRIRRAIELCFQAIGKRPSVSLDEDIMYRVLNTVAARGATDVEALQDIVEMTLAGAGEFEAAKAYILYRAEHARLRALQPIPVEVQQAFDESAKYFPTQLQMFQFYDKYSRYDYDKGRRETWPETVDRTIQFLRELVYMNVNSDVELDMVQSGTFKRIQTAILNMQSMPSMRLLAMAGPAARRQNLAIYNCSYLTIDSVESFVEALLISMAGCGVGFSVEKEHVAKLPRIEHQRDVPRKQYVVEDTTEGWGDAISVGLTEWVAGRDVDFDFSHIRPAGTPLRIKGGRASGPLPLKNALIFARERILSRQGGYLRPLDAHDLCCQVANSAISGGVRRSAMISLFDVDDDEMARCKIGDFETKQSQRWNANNSALLPEDGISQAQFLKFWQAMVESERGEPGMVSRQAMKATLPSRRKWHKHMGVNPCSEINLRPQGLCNLSICVARSNDTLESLRDKVEIATIIGTIQSLATHFPGLRPEWKKNCEEERLLGVDITGQRDCPLLEDPEVLDNLKQHAIEVNALWASRFGINQSAAVTTVKPSGNSSVLLDCSSGMHARWSKYYERNVRVGATSPIYKVLRDAGVPLSPENGQETWPEPTTYVANFLVKSPEGALTRNDLSAIDQCEYWLHVKQHWSEHNVSVTITYKPDEIIPLFSWLWQHIEMLGGMAFLPANDIALAQLPYQEISAEEYERRNESFPTINWARLVRYETTDLTEAAQLVACSSGVCEI